ncbi:2948_t:CDS:2, partial [Funneliformis geosporum]
MGNLILELVSHLYAFRADLRKFPTPTTDRDQTVSRRSEPNSRTALMGEQPNPWKLLHLQDAMSRHRGAKHFRRYGLLESISLLSPG